MIKVACVLKSGGDFDWDYVSRLREGVRAHLTLDHEFVCLTDIVEKSEHFIDDTVIPLTRGWPGWWSKLELFGVEGPLLYFDLDTMIVGNIDPLAAMMYDAEPTLQIIHDFYHPTLYQSTLMGWGPYSMSHVLDKFAVRADRTMRNHGGDQQWLMAAGVPMTAIDLPGIYSYKVHVQGKGVPDDARVVCFHGRPRPHEVGWEL